MKNKTVKTLFVLGIVCCLVKFSFAADEEQKILAVDKEKPKVAVKEVNKPAPAPKVDASSFIIIKNKTPEQMFDDANYLYQLGEYESALILFNKVSTQSSDPVLKRKSNTAREIIDILMKAERVGNEKAPKEYKRAEKIKSRQRNDQVSYLSNEARGKFLKNDYETAASLFRVILQLDPTQKEAKEYLDIKIPQKLKEQKSSVLYSEAQAALKNKEYDKAKSLCQDSLALDSKNQETCDCLNVKILAAIKEDKIKALLTEGVTAFDSQKYDQAAGTFKDILILNSSQEQAREYLDIKIPQKLKEQKIKQLYSEGLGYFNAKDYAQATTIFKEIIALDSDQAQAEEYLDVKIPAALKEKNIQDSLREAAQFFTLGDCTKASELFNQVLSLDPNNVQAKKYLEEDIPAKLSQIADEIAKAKQEEMEKSMREQQEAQSSIDRKRQEEIEKERLRAAKLKREEALISRKVSVVQPELSVSPDYPKEGAIGYLYECAFTAYNNGNLQDARDYFTKILLVSPREKVATNYLVKIIKRQKNGL